MTTTTELTVVERAAVSLQSTERETALRELVAKSTDLVEIKNAAAREQVHGAAMALRTARTDIEKAGKVARDDANAFSKAVIAEANRLVAITEPEEKRLLALRQAWDDEREAEKEAKRQAEARRVALIREHIEDIRSIAARAVGRPSAAIAVEIQDLEALGITLDRFQELTGEAEAARDATLDKLRELHAAAMAHEAEEARLAAERDELARQRAELVEQQRQEQEARAERERIDRERREEEDALVESIWANARRIESNTVPYIRKAIETFESVASDWESDSRQRVSGAIAFAREEMQKKLRDAEETAARDAADAERREALAAEEARLVEQRAEMARRQAELDRAEREQREREEAAAREAAELAAQAERDRAARERAENRAAMLAPEPTGGTWSVGKHSGCVVTTADIAGCPGSGHNDAEYYGGNLICESVYRPADAHLIAAARDAIDALKLVRASTEWSCMEASTQDAVDAAIAKATYVPAEESATA
ncbi:hypothetical protein [Burkholderia gladioli]|uniref:hypothetical protein n=1 Tax=Burkholderia gladioli TaxID=28095 RepID=UPI003D23D977